MGYPAAKKEEERRREGAVSITVEQL